MNKILIFDLDGTLLDSNHVWDGVDRAFLGRRNLPYTKEYLEGVAHVILQNAAAFTKEHLHLEESCEDIINEWMELAGDAYNHVSTKPFVHECILMWKALKIPMVIFTSCVPEHCISALENNDIYGCFDKIIFAQDLGINKKSPKAFQRLAEMLDTIPENCVFFDDSLSNCEAAKEAGMEVIGVYDPISVTQESEMERVCDRYIRSFSELRGCLWTSILSKFECQIIQECRDDGMSDDESLHG